MSRPEDMRRIREILQRRRRDLLGASAAVLSELRALKGQERDPEYEEGAQSDLADYTLSHVLETQRRELLAIDAAVDRMDEGRFGICIDCEQEISYERLEAMPFAIRCEEDARRDEMERLSGSAMPSL